VKAAFPLFCLVSLIAVFGSACGTTGKSSRFVLHLSLRDSPLAIKTIEIASAQAEPSAAELLAVNVNEWGKFNTNDLLNIEQSLRDTLSASLPTATKPESPLRVHFLIRKYLLATSNTEGAEGAILACVAWAATDASNAILRQEQFYAANSVRLFGTIGLLKDSVHRTIVRRIAESALYLASEAGALSEPKLPEDTFPSFEEAVSHLPKRMVSMSVPYFPGDPLPLWVVADLLTSPSRVEKVGWAAARPASDID